MAVEPSPEETPKIEPWFTGPIFLRSGYTPGPGVVYVEPYLFFSDIFGQYDARGHAHSTEKLHALTPLLWLQIGLGKRWELDLQPSFTTSWQEGRSATGFDDLLTSLGYQLIKSHPDHWWPDLKLNVDEVWPTGRYQHLNPDKVGIDATGEGLFTTAVGLIAAKVYPLGCYQFLNLGLSAFYTFPSSTHVSGFNSYGGGFGTDGRVHVGRSVVADLGMEYEWSRHWACALDIVGTWSKRSHFTGTVGTDATGLPAQVGKPSSAECSLAPAIEYNWSPKMGLIVGPWFTVAGRNTDQFVAGVAALAMIF